MNLHNLFTVKVISGRVQLEMKFARATSLRYSVQLCGSGVSGQSCFENTMLAAHGVEVGLHSSMPARSSSVLIVLRCEIVMERAAASYLISMPRKQVRSPTVVIVKRLRS